MGCPTESTGRQTRADSYAVTALLISTGRSTQKSGPVLPTDYAEANHRAWGSLSSVVRSKPPVLCSVLLPEKGIVTVTAS